MNITALLLEFLHSELLHWLPTSRRIPTAIDGLVLTRIDQQSSPEKCLYYPLIALVIQGRKRAFYGENELTYGAGEFVILGNDMPGAYHILDSTPDRPFLSLSIRLDPRRIASLCLEGNARMPQARENESAVGKEKAGEDLLLAFYRLLRLLREPESIPICAQAVLTEIHYYILKGPLGDKLRLAATPDTRDNRIAQSITWLRGHFRENFLMPELARLVNMAPSTFNRCFRELTSVSPLQFQKRLRLYEAQRLMTIENMDARAAALTVGYESEAQFSREYKRLFGQPPKSHILPHRA